MNDNKINEIEQTLQSGAKEFDHKPSDGVLVNVISSIKKNNRSQIVNVNYIPWLVSAGFTMLAVFIVLINFNPNSQINEISPVQNQIAIKTITYDFNELLDMNIDDISDNIEQKLMADMKKESQAVKQDLLYFRSLMTL